MADLEPGQAQFTISPTMEDLVQAAAADIVDAARAAVAARGVFYLALSGGSTPRMLYALLATPEYARQIPWDDTVLFWGDERHVPPDSPDSNYRMAREALLDHVPIPAANIHRMMAELPDPATVAVAYADQIRRAFAATSGEPGEGDGNLPRFDLILLGMGEDGHTASLFPSSPALHERTALVVANPVDKLDTTRITFTLPLINNAARIWFLIAGGSKSQVLKRVLEGPHEPETLPSQLINPVDGELVFMLDQAAASALSPQLRGGSLAGIA